MFKIKTLNYISIFSIVLLITYFYYQFFYYTMDVPINDDYQAVLQFINNFKTSQSFKERFTLLFSQHNEHRIVYDRIWVLICYKIFGVVNFNFLSFIGNVSYLIIFYILSIPFKNFEKVFLLPIAVLIFNFAYHENITFPMATLSNNTGFLFSILSLYFACKENKLIYLSFIFYVMAVFTVGSGLFLTPLLGIIYFYKKQKQILIFYTALVIFTLLFYFYDYSKPEHLPSFISTLELYKAKSIIFFFTFLGSIFSYYLIFTNDFNESIVLSGIFGAIFLIIYLFVFSKKRYKKNIFVFSLISYIFIVALLTCVSRSQMGLETSIASRYRLYSGVLFIGLYYFVLEHLKINIKYKYIGVVSFSLFYFLNFSFKQCEYLDYRNYLNYLGIINYNSGNHKLLNGFEQDYYKEVILKSYYSETYYLPKESELNNYFPFSKVTPNKNKKNNTEIWFTNGIEQIFNLKDSYLIFGKGFLIDQSSHSQNIYLEIESLKTKKILTFNTKKMKRYDTNPYFKKDNLDYAGFLCRIDKKLLDKDEYSIKLIIENKNYFKKEISTEKLINL